MPDEKKEALAETAPERTATAENERMRILRLLADGKITPEQAGNLLEALGPQPEFRGVVRTAAQPPAPSGAGRTLHIKIEEPDGDKVNIAVPLSLASTITKLLPKEKLAQRGIDLDALLSQLQSGEQEFIKVEGKDGEKVRIFVE